ncbi:MAG: endo-1,4-beta-xylanase, partial [Defluviitaleaceae bacterium]|nr:endo-1,4-beta-xylanase [Defluviitaleaceae bacterium]
RRTGQGLPDDNVNITRWYDAFANGADESLGECGSDYVYYAFRFARIYDPFAILYYNDYNEFERNKRDAIAHMVEDINERWRDDPLYDGRLLIEGIGMQSHYNLRNWPSSVSPVRVALERFIETGARVSITELNVYLEGGGIVPSDENLPELFVEQATRYRELFELYLEFSDHIERVTFFIWQDLPAQQGAWRRWPHSQHPALFDLERNAKPAFHAVLEALDNAAVPNISVPFVTQNFTQQTTGSDRFILGLNATQNNFAPIRWRIVEGELPEGLYLHPVTGVIMGVFANPTANPDRYYTFTVAAENAAGYGTREFTINQSNMSIDWWSSEYPHAPPPIAEPPTENSAYNAENDTENDTENGTENNTAELLADADPQPMEDEPSEDEIAPATDAETSDNRAVMFIAVLVVGGVAFYVFKKARQARN